MKNRFAFRFLAALALLAALPAAALAAETYSIDKVHSSVGFRIRHLTAHVTGTFTDFSGAIVLDEEDVTKSSVEAVIQTASINTNNADRDDHLRAPDFFDAAQFPTITFKSKRVEGAKGRFRVTGDFTMHGVTKEVVLDVEYFGKMAMGPGKPEKAGFSATTEIIRSEFGVSYGAGIMMGDAVKISIDIEAAPPKKEAPPAPAAEKKDEAAKAPAPAAAKK